MGCAPSTSPHSTDSGSRWSAGRRGGCDRPRAHRQVEVPPLDRERLEREAAEQRIGSVTASRRGHALESKVRRVASRVRPRDPDRIGGSVESRFCGALLLHLRDPVRALERILNVLEPGGELRLLEPFSVSFDIQVSAPARVALSPPQGQSFSWWLGNLAAIRALPLAAGFADTRRLGFFRPPGAHRDTYVGLACQAGGLGRAWSHHRPLLDSRRGRHESERSEEIDQG